MLYLNIVIYKKKDPQWLGGFLDITPQHWECGLDKVELQDATYQDALSSSLLVSRLWSGILCHDALIISASSIQRSFSMDLDLDLAPRKQDETNGPSSRLPSLLKISAFPFTSSSSVLTVITAKTSRQQANRHRSVRP